MINIAKISEKAHMMNDEQQSSNGALSLSSDPGMIYLPPLSLKEISISPELMVGGWVQRESKLAYMPLILDLNGMRFADLQKGLAYRFPALQRVAGAMGLILEAKTQTDAGNAILSPPAGIDEKQLVDWYIENNATIFIYHFVKDA